MVFPENQDDGPAVPIFVWIIIGVGIFLCCLLGVGFVLYRRRRDRGPGANGSQGGTNLVGAAFDEDEIQAASEDDNFYFDDTQGLPSSNQYGPPPSQRTSGQQQQQQSSGRPSSYTGQYSTGGASEQGISTVTNPTYGGGLDGMQNPGGVSSTRQRTDQGTTVQPGNPGGTTTGGGGGGNARRNSDNGREGNFARVFARNDF